jgi:chromosome segregation ATPase
MYEEKLTQQEDEHETEISELKALYKSEQEKLEDVIGTLKNDIETIKRQIKRIQDERDQFNSLKEKASKKKKKLKELLEEKKVLIK